MVAKDEEVFEAVVRRWSKWWSGVPNSLKRQESSVVALLLTLGLRKGGISQSDLQQGLGISQSRLSKLVKKLVKAGWIQLKRSEVDSRKQLTTTTAAGRDAMAKLKSDLAAPLRASRAEPAPTPTQRTKPSVTRRRRGVQSLSKRQVDDLPYPCDL